MKVQILVDNKESWIVPYAIELVKEIRKKFDFEVKLIHNHSEVESGDLLFLLSCEKIFKKLQRNKHNLVIHESDLPKGKGWSPITWQILEGKNRIPITLFEAAEKVDAGQIYFQDFIVFEGHELLSEIKEKQGFLTKNLILKFLETYPNIIGTPQSGEESFYNRRTPKDSQLDIEQSINKQFNLLRVCDNERYPAYFVKDRIKYVLKIFKADE